MYKDNKLNNMSNEIVAYFQLEYFVMHLEMLKILIKVNFKS